MLVHIQRRQKDEHPLQWFITMMAFLAKGYFRMHTDNSSTVCDSTRRVIDHKRELLAVSSKSNMMIINPTDSQLI